MVCDEARQRFGVGAIKAALQQDGRQGVHREQALLWLDEWGLVFTTKHGTPIEAHNLLRHFQAMCERIGLPRMRFHELHHTCAALLLAQGVEPRVSMGLLGHSMISTTLDVYATSCRPSSATPPTRWTRYYAPTATAKAVAVPVAVNR
ncbi:MAG: tyrosine-type recombinase/integrase [Egibacteraceae bacterium]